MKGNYFNDMFHGHGRHEFSDGDIYEGSYKENLK